MKLMLEKPNFLILDEPTNHLDLEMIEWLEGFLSRGNKTLLMVTHDRYFLDRVCNLIVELDNNTIFTYQGSYAYYLEKRQARLDNARAEVQHANNLYRRELDWMRRQPQARGHKAKYREDAFYELEAKAKQRIEERQVRLKAATFILALKSFECQYVSKAWSAEKVILRDFYYNFARFEKWVSWATTVRENHLYSYATWRGSAHFRPFCHRRNGEIRLFLAGGYARR